MMQAVDEIRLSNVVALPVEGESDAVRHIREQAAQRYATLGLPTTRLEEWKYTSLAALARHDFRLDGAAASQHDNQGFSFAGVAIAELVFVNGHLVTPLTAGLPPGLRVTRLSDALRRGEVLEHYSRYADYHKHAMTALNTALAQDGAVIEIEAGTVIEGFVHFLFIGSATAEPLMMHPRTLVIAGRASQIGVVESFIGDGTYFTNSVTEIVAGEGAVIDYARIQAESLEAFHVGTVQVHQERSSSVTTRNFSIGGALVRSEINVALTGEGANTTLDGLFVLNGTQHVDNHTVIDHVEPHCESQELYKGILDGSARGIFDGLIIVRPDAQKTVSRQVNRNLLLSESAIIDSKPTLEIHNDDVKCNHGSTIGQLEEEPMFYLRSRGLGEDEARSLLIYAFASEIVDRMKVGPVKEQVRRAMFRQMPARLPERRETSR